LTAGRSEPSYEVMRQQLVRLNVPYTTVDVITTDLTADLLQTGSDGNFSMIILSTGNLAYERDAGVWESALSAAEWDRLWNYARTHAVRTIAYYTFPTAEYGLSWTGEVTTNTTGRLTTAGRRIFADVQPSAAIPIRSYTYLSTPLPGFTPWVIDPSGRPLIGLWQPGDGREILVSTTDQGVYEIASALRAASPTAWPNTRIVAFADELLARKGRMSEAIEAIGPGAPALEAEPFAIPARFGARRASVTHDEAAGRDA
jgi:hypothetical protein